MNEKVVITLDTREKDEQFLSYLRRFGAIVDMQQLPIGDIAIFGKDRSYVIERKKINDLGNSIADGRLFEQIKVLVESSEMGEFSYIPCLLVIGYQHTLWKNRGFNDAQIAGIENALQFKWNVKLMFAHNNRYAALKVINLARDIQLEKESKVHSMRHIKRKDLSPEEEALYVLQGFPAISGVRAKNILDHYKTLDKSLDAMRNGEIREINGLGDKIAETVAKVFTYGVDEGGKEE